MAGNKRWSLNDLNILKLEYGLTPNEELSKKLGRSIDAIQWKANKIGLEDSNKGILININKRLEILERNTFEILDYLKTSHSRHANVSDEEKKKVVEMYSSGKTVHEIAVEVGRTIPTIYKMMTLLNIQRVSNKIDFTIQEKQFILDNYLQMSNANMAKHLNAKEHRVSAYLRGEAQAGRLAVIKQRGRHKK